MTSSAPMDMDASSCATPCTTRECAQRLDRIRRAQFPSRAAARLEDHPSLLGRLWVHAFAIRSETDAVAEWTRVVFAAYALDFLQELCAAAATHAAEHADMGYSGWLEALLRAADATESDVDSARVLLVNGAVLLQRRLLRKCPAVSLAVAAQIHLVPPHTSVTHSHVERVTRALAAIPGPGSETTAAAVQRAAQDRMTVLLLPHLERRHPPSPDRAVFPALDDALREWHRALVCGGWTTTTQATATAAQTAAAAVVIHEALRLGMALYYYSASDTWRDLLWSVLRSSVLSAYPWTAEGAGAAERTLDPVATLDHWRRHVLPCHHWVLFVRATLSAFSGGEVMRGLEEAVRDERLYMEQNATTERRRGLPSLMFPDPCRMHSSIVAEKDGWVGELSFPHAWPPLAPSFFSTELPLPAPYRTMTTTAHAPALAAPSFLEACATCWAARASPSGDVDDAPRCGCPAASGCVLDWSASATAPREDRASDTTPKSKRAARTDASSAPSKRARATRPQTLVPSSSTSSAADPAVSADGTEDDSVEFVAAHPHGTTSAIGPATPGAGFAAVPIEQDRPPTRARRTDLFPPPMSVVPLRASDVFRHPVHLYHPQSPYPQFVATWGATHNDVVWAWNVHDGIVSASAAELPAHDRVLSVMGPFTHFRHAQTALFMSELRQRVCGPFPRSSNVHRRAGAFLLLLRADILNHGYDDAVVLPYLMHVHETQSTIRLASRAAAAASVGGSSDSRPARPSNSWNASACRWTLLEAMPSYRSDDTSDASSLLFEMAWNYAFDVPTIPRSLLYMDETYRDYFNTRVDCRAALTVQSCPRCTLYHRRIADGPRIEGIVCNNAAKLRPMLFGAADVLAGDEGKALCEAYGIGEDRRLSVAERFAQLGAAVIPRAAVNATARVDASPANAAFPPTRWREVCRDVRSDNWKSLL